MVIYHEYLRLVACEDGIARLEQMLDCWGPHCSDTTCPGPPENLAAHANDLDPIL